MLAIGDIVRVKREPAGSPDEIATVVAVNKTQVRVTTIGNGEGGTLLRWFNFDEVEK